MISKYHTRQGYKSLYKQLYATGRKPHERLYTPVSWLSDYQLLRMINHELKRLDCMTLTGEELEMELH